MTWAPAKRATSRALKASWRAVVLVVAALWRAAWSLGERVARRIWPDREAMWRFVGPLLFSVGVHAAILVVLAVAALVLTSPRSAPAGEVVISFDAPEIIERTQRDSPNADVSPSLPDVESLLSESGYSPELPSLIGIASGEPTSLPELRSEDRGSLEEVVAALREREPDVPIGASFAGLGARRASRVVYVVDASGAMVTSMGLVQDELERSINRLGESQRFQLVLYRDRRRAGETGQSGLYEIYGADDADGARLLRGTVTSKQLMSEWLRGVRPQGRSNPLDGLRAALSLEPDVVFLLARSIPRSGGEDGAGVWGLGLEQTLAELDRLNPVNPRTGHRQTVIKTIQFLEEDPTGVMPAIGASHGDGLGSYRVLTLEDLRGP